MIFYEGEYPVQHNQQLGEPGQGGTHLSVLWKKLSLESCLGETHTEATRGKNDAEEMQYEFSKGLRDEIPKLTAGFTGRGRGWHEVARGDPGDPL